MTDQPYPDPPRPTIDDFDPEIATTDRMITMARRHREGQERTLVARPQRTAQAQKPPGATRGKSRAPASTTGRDAKPGTARRVGVRQGNRAMW